MITWLHPIEEFSFDYCNSAIFWGKKSPKRSVFYILFLLRLWHHPASPISSWLWIHVICLIFIVKLAQSRLWKFNIILSIYNQQKANRFPSIFSKHQNEKRTNCENDSELYNVIWAAGGEAVWRTTCNLHGKPEKHESWVGKRFQRTTQGCMTINARYLNMGGR